MNCLLRGTRQLCWSWSYRSESWQEAVYHWNRLSACCPGSLSLEESPPSLGVYLPEPRGMSVAPGPRQGRHKESDYLKSHSSLTSNRLVVNCLSEITARVWQRWSTDKLAPTHLHLYNMLVLHDTLIPLFFYISMNYLSPQVIGIWFDSLYGLWIVCFCQQCNPCADTAVMGVFCGDTNPLAPYLSPFAEVFIVVNSTWQICFCR